MDDFMRPNAKGAHWDVPRDKPYLLCRIKPGRDWWDLDDRLSAVPGRRPVYARNLQVWHAIPKDQISSLRVISEAAPGRLVAHPSD